MITPREAKKIRKQHRSQKEKEKLEAIQMGLIDPPKPKVKVTRLMRDLEANLFRDPTQVEQEMRKKLMERQHAHHNRNMADKLTPLELREKRERKLFDDGLLTHVVLFRIDNSEHPKNKYRVEINAIENRLSGISLKINNSTLVVVEGCKKSQARFFKLMTNRINWKLRKVDGVDAYAESGATKCQLIWRGTVKKPTFERFRTLRDLSEVDARKFLKDCNAEQYWNIFRAFESH